MIGSCAKPRLAEAATFALRYTYGMQATTCQAHMAMAACAHIDRGVVLCCARALQSSQ